MNDAVKAFEVLGVLILIVGGLIALVGCIIELAHGEDASRVFDDVRARLGRAILLGLEILVVADIIRTIVVSPTLSSALTLGLIRRRLGLRTLAIRAACHAALFHATALLVWLQHGAVFRAAGWNFRRFWADSQRGFRRLQARIREVACFQCSIEEMRLD